MIEVAGGVGQAGANVFGLQGWKIGQDFLRRRAVG